MPIPEDIDVEFPDPVVPLVVGLALLVACVPLFNVVPLLGFVALLAGIAELVVARSRHKNRRSGRAQIARILDGDDED